jgi:rhamnosyltransferase
VVVAIVVTYNPILADLFKLLSALKGQVQRTVLIDNGTLDAQSFDNSLVAALGVSTASRIERVFLGSNQGLASAQNTGIELARTFDPDQLIFFDQDSLPDGAMVSGLLKAYAELVSQGNSIGALGPRFSDPRRQDFSPFISIRGLRLIRHQCLNESKPIEVDYLIASGSMISMRTLEAVGVMRADLFIDYIDIEWGLRAREMGFKNFGVCAAKMNHPLGDTPIEIFGFSLPNHSPLRHYYMTRNALVLYKDKSLPLNWKIVDGYKLVLKIGFYCLFAKPRFAHLTNICRGLAHGLMGNTGRPS